MALAPKFFRFGLCLGSEESIMSQKNSSTIKDHIQSCQIPIPKSCVFFPRFISIIQLCDVSPLCYFFCCFHFPPCFAGWPSCWLWRPFVVRGFRILSFAVFRTEFPVCRLSANDANFGLTLVHQKLAVMLAFFTLRPTPLNLSNGTIFVHAFSSIFVFFHITNIFECPAFLHNLWQNPTVCTVRKQAAVFVENLTYRHWCCVSQERSIFPRHLEAKIPAGLCFRADIPREGLQPKHLSCFFFDFFFSGPSEKGGGKPDSNAKRLVTVSTCGVTERSSPPRPPRPLRSWLLSPRLMPAR